MPKVSQEARNLIMSFERLVLRAYQVPGDVPTIGFGHTSSAGAPRVELGMTITREQAYAIFDRDIALFAAELAKKITVELNDNAFGAVVSVGYNVGPARIPTLVNRINRGDMAGAAQTFMLYVNFNGKPCAGLIRRRNAERCLFLGDIAGAERYAQAHLASVRNDKTAHAMPQKIDAPAQPKSIGQSKTANAALAGATAVVASGVDAASTHIDALSSAWANAQAAFAQGKGAVSSSFAALAALARFAAEHPSLAFGLGCTVGALIAFGFVWFDRRRRLREDLV